MPRGPAPAPTALKRLKGFPGKRAVEYNGTEPEPPKGAPTEPEHVKADPIAHAEWEDVCKHLDSMGILARTDRVVLECYVVAYSDWRRSVDMVRKFGDVQITGKNKHAQVAPWVSNRNAAFQQLKVLLSELGLTPAARARLRTTVKEDSDNPWLKLVS